MLCRGSCRWCRCDAACNDYGSRAKRQVWPRPEAACRIPAEQQLGKENSCCKEERNAEKEKCFSKKDRREKKVRKRDKPFANAANTRCKSPPRHRRLIHCTRSVKSSSAEIQDTESCKGVQVEMAAGSKVFFKSNEIPGGNETLALKETD